MKKLILKCIYCEQDVERSVAIHNPVCFDCRIINQRLRTLKKPILANLETNQEIVDLHKQVIEDRKLTRQALRVKSNKAKIQEKSKKAKEREKEVLFKSKHINITQKISYFKGGIYISHDNLNKLLNEM